MTGTNLVEAARLAETYGDGEIRLATDQNLILTGVPEPKLDALLAEPLLQTHSPNPKPFERGAVACTGSEFCRLAIVETKARALQWAQELDRRVHNRRRRDRSASTSPGAPPPAPSRRSPTSASAAKPPRPPTPSSRESTSDSAAASAATPPSSTGSRAPSRSSEVPDALVRLFDRYVGERREGERFHEWARRVPNAELRATHPQPGGGAP